jgi:hypothetical protein
MKRVDTKDRRKEVAAIANLLHFAELSAEDLDQPFLVYLIRLARHEAGTGASASTRTRRAVSRRSAPATQNLN